MHTDPWLDRWLPLLQHRADDIPVLEIGCGSGADTRTLLDAGLNVYGFDLSAEAVALAKVRAPGARVDVRDTRDEFPSEVLGTAVIVASLSLHYFPWEVTVSLIERIRRTLRPGGLLVCRLNSTQDANFGASGHPELEPNYYLVDGAPKRFFDKPAIEVLFKDGWRFLALEHFTTNKYSKPKALWELLCERCDA